MASSSGRALSATLTKGLTTPRIRTRANHTGGSDVPLMLEMSRLMRFLPWVEKSSEKSKYGRPNDFDNKVKTKRDIMRRTLAREGCKPGQGSSSSSRSSSSCDGTFRQTSCHHDSCRVISDYKRTFKDDFPGFVCRQESELYLSVGMAFKHLKELATRVEPNWTSVGVHPDCSLNGIRLQKPDYVVVDENKKCLFAVEVKHPRIRLRGIEEKVKSTAIAIAAEYGHQFHEKVREYEASNEKNKKIKLDALHKAIIQTCFYALSVESGLAALLTLNEAVFFQARPQLDTHGKIHRIDMLTSRVYDCNPEKPDEASVLDAFFAFMTSSRHVGQVNGIFRAQRFLAGAIDDEKNGRKEEKKKDGKDGGNNSSVHKRGSSSGHQSGSSSKKHGDDSKSKKRDKGVQRTFVSFLMSQMILDNMKNLPNRFENVPRKERIEMIRNLGRDEYWRVNIVELEDMFMKNYYEVIGEGASGCVVRADVGEFGVAIKVLNVNSDYEPLFESGPTPLDMLKNEISVYKWIAKEHPELLGNVIPRLYAVLEDADNENDTAFVTEYVGEKLVRYDLNDEGSEAQGKERFEWYVDGRRLSPRDIKQINEAATEALGELLKRGIVHYDVREDNLRVERIVDDAGDSKWKVWWVDFGIVRIDEGESYEKCNWELGSEEAIM